MTTTMSQMSSTMSPVHPTVEEGVEYIVGNKETNDYIKVVRNWMPPHLADRYFKYYLEQNWYVQLIGEAYGKKYLKPRLMYAMGKMYFGDEETAHGDEWDPATLALMNLASVQMRFPFDSALLNFYRDGTDYIADHADREAVGANFTVVIISLGASRLFDFRKKADRKVKRTITINHGDVIVMSGKSIQDNFLHGLPRMKDVGPRISLSFRCMEPPTEKK